MNIGMDADGISVLNHTLQQRFISLNLRGNNKECRLNVVFLQRIQNLRCDRLGRAVVKGQIADLLVAYLDRCTHGIRVQPRVILGIVRQIRIVLDCEVLFGLLLACRLAVVDNRTGRLRRTRRHIRRACRSTEILRCIRRLATGACRGEDDQQQDDNQTAEADHTAALARFASALRFFTGNLADRTRCALGLCLGRSAADALLTLPLLLLSGFFLCLLVDTLVYQHGILLCLPFRCRLRRRFRSLCRSLRLFRLAACVVEQTLQILHFLDRTLSLFILLPQEIRTSSVFFVCHIAPPLFYTIINGHLIPDYLYFIVFFDKNQPAFLIIPV